eukprot:evm.model.NODE_50279_length_19378_cov_37.169006.3
MSQTPRKAHRPPSTRVHTTHWPAGVSQEPDATNSDETKSGEATEDHRDGGKATGFPALLNGAFGEWIV